MAQIILPEMDVSTVGRDAYNNIIRQVRTTMGVKISSYQLPVLPPSPPPTAAGDGLIQFCDMTLRSATNGAIRLRLRRDNLYLVGFQILSSGVWYEFTPDRSRLITGSTLLGFTGSYIDLETVSVDRLVKLTFGRGAVQDAVIRLSNSTTAREIRARSLMILIVFICESSRFTHISDFIAPLLIASNPTRILGSDTRAEPIIKNWGKLSELLLKREQDPTLYFPPNPPPAEMEIRNYLDAVAVLGALKEVTATTTTTIATYAAGDERQYKYPLGDPLVEVFWVKIDKECDLYGTIEVTDGTGSQYLFKRASEESVKTRPGELVLLTSPDRSILAYDSFAINVDLKDGNNNKTNTSSTIDEINNGKLISWTSLDTSNIVYDQPIEKVLNGEFGSVIVNYVVLSDAVKAEIEVTLIKGDDDKPVNIHGKFTVSIGNFEDGIVLFNKAPEEHIGVASGQLIPLLRSVVAVPLNSSLIFQADIYVNGNIANGTAVFPAQLSAVSELTIRGEFGEIRVKVTWSKAT